MDIKIITQSDTHIIYTEIQTLLDLKKEIKKLGIQTNNMIIYFYDNDFDKVVITQEEDLSYVYHQSKIQNRQKVKFYIYYKLSQPKFHHKETQINISTKQPQTDWINQTFQKESCQSIVYQNLYNNHSFFQNINSIIQKQTREEMMKLAIDSFIDQILQDEYNI